MRTNSVLLVLALILLVLSIAPSAVWAQQTNADKAISAAQQKILTCFNAVRAAEAAGANITELANTLNRASLLLSQSEFAYSTGNFEAAQSFAVQSYSSLSLLVSNAKYLGIAATQTRDTDFLLNVVGPLAGTIAVLFGSVALWVLLKRKYANRG
jgi:hypothetical protein